MNLTELSKKIYQANKEKGFWGEERNIGELFMLIISECAEALEAHRKGRFADLFSFQRYNDFEKSFELLNRAKGIFEFEKLFEDFIKDSFEDELADIVIRVLDYMGSQNMEVIDVLSGDLWLETNVGAMLCDTCELIIEARNKMETCKTPFFRMGYCRNIVIHVFAIAQYLNIDLNRHIELKLQYNATRPYKHGKKY